MNAYIAYSIGENEQYLLTLLAQKVAETGLTLVTSYNQSDTIDAQIANNIKNAALFIGLVTRSGRLSKTSRVYSEFAQANLYNKPAILLIEDTVSVPLHINSYSNTVRFNRYFINQAIEDVKNRIKLSQTQPQKSNDAAAWILGGLGILALLSLLSEKKK